MNKAKSLIEDLWHLFRASKLKLLGQIVFIILCFYFLVWRLVEDWSDVQAFLIDVEWSRLASSSMVLALAFLIFPVATVIYTHRSEQKINYQQSARAFFGSQLTKYLPGSLWVIPSRVILLQRAGMALSLSSNALMFEIITLVFSSAIIGAVFMSIVGTGTEWISRLVLIIFTGGLTAIGLFLISPELIQRFSPKSIVIPNGLTQMAEVPILTRLTNIVLASAVYSAMWFLAGFSFFLLLVAIDPTINNSLMFYSIGVFTISWLIGYLSFFSPGGIGVRESVIVILLSTVMSDPYPVIAALISRVIWLIVEMLFIIGFWLFARVVSSPRPTT